MLRGYLENLSWRGSMQNPTVTLEKVSIIRALGLRHTKQKILSVKYGSQKMQKSDVVWTHNINARITLNPASFDFLGLQWWLCIYKREDTESKTLGTQVWGTLAPLTLEWGHSSGPASAVVQQSYTDQGETGHQQETRQGSTGRTSDGVWKLH